MNALEDWLEYLVVSVKLSAVIGEFGCGMMTLCIGGLASGSFVLCFWQGSGTIILGGYETTMLVLDPALPMGRNACT